MEAVMAKRIVVPLAFFLFAATNSAEAIECLGLPDVEVRGVWSRQIVDGKACWYLGDKSVPKEQLRWPDSPQGQSRRVAGPPPGQKIQCHVEVDKSKGGRWHWRTVDGKQCWFIGDRETAREWLQWPRQEQTAFANNGEAVAGNEAEPAEVPPESLYASGLVNQESTVDLVFLAHDAWVALLSIDFNVGAEYLTDVSIHYWPVIAARTPRLDRIVAAAREPGEGVGY
jgi:hypothetical protein